MKIQKINEWFGRRAHAIIRFRWLWIGIFVILLVAGFNGLQYMNMSTSWDDYFLEDDPILIKTDEFKEIFGNDNFVAVLTQCNNTFTKENLKLIRELSNELLDSISYADKITSLTDIEFLAGTDYGMNIEQIVPDVIPATVAGLDSVRIKAYLKKNIASRLVSSDGKLSWILLKLRAFPDVVEWRKDGSRISPEMLTGEQAHHILNKEKYKSISPMGAGMPHLSFRKMDWVGKEFPRIMGMAFVLAVIVLIIATKSFRGVVVPVLTSLSSIVIVYGALGYWEYKIDSGMVSIPVLIAFAVAIAYNIHVFSYFKRQFLLHGQRKKAVVETVSEMGWPVLFSALTTFTALLSFLVIPVVPLHFIGIATSSCVLLTFFIVIVIMPVCLSMGKDRVPKPVVNEKGGRWLDRKLMSVGDWVLSHGKIITLGSLILAVVLIYGASRIETAFDVENTMGRKIPYVDESLFVAESKLGSMYSYDVLIEFPENGQAKLPLNLVKLDSLSDYVATFPLSKRVSSILDIIKDLNQTLNENRTNFYAVPDDANQVAQMLLLYENAGGSEAEYWIDYDYRRLRLMIELSNYNSGQAERELEDVLAKAGQIFPGAKITCVGSLPQFTAMMQYVVRGQVLSFGIAIIIIALLLMFVFGSIRIGLIGIIPNIAPALVVGGIMGWFGIPLDMMTATIIPMILGLAVDDTIHFINHGHLEFNRKRNYNSAIRRTFFVVGTPLVLTSIVISANFAVYMTSVAKSFAHMGLLSICGMMAALLSDLLITPVLFRKYRIFGKEMEQAKAP